MKLWCCNRNLEDEDGEHPKWELSPFLINTSLICFSVGTLCTLAGVGIILISVPGSALGPIFFCGALFLYLTGLMMCLRGGACRHCTKSKHNDIESSCDEMRENEEIGQEIVNEQALYLTSSGSSPTFVTIDSLSNGGLLLCQSDLQRRLYILFNGNCTSNVNACTLRDLNLLHNIVVKEDEKPEYSRQSSQKSVVSLYDTTDNDLPPKYEDSVRQTDVKSFQEGD